MQLLRVRSAEVIDVTILGRKTELPAQDLLIRDAHLLCRPRLQYRIFIVSDSQRHLTRACSIAVERMIGVVLDRPAESCRRADPVGARGKPRKTARCEIGNLV